MKKLFIAWFVLLYSASVSAQEIEVKKFQLLKNDQTAALSPRKDINGVTCWLVKVALKEPGIYVITGGAIKLTCTMQEREHTLQELTKMEMVRFNLLRTTQLTRILLMII